MPELPEVETVRRGLAGPLEGRVLAEVVQRRPDLRFPLPEKFAERLTGRRVVRVGRRAKYLTIDLDDGWTLLAHLGMSGRMVLSARPAPPLDPHDHILLTTDAGQEIRFNDARRFGMMDLWPTADLAEHRLLRGLGPEPLSEAFDAAYLDRVLDGRRTSIKAALLDQRVVAGIGNIYASEILFEAWVSPRRLAATVPGRRAARIADATRAVLERAIAAGGSSLRDYVQTDGELGYFQHQWRVYGREGLPCVGCAVDRDGCTGIRRIAQAGRSTFYCARRQR